MNSTERKEDVELLPTQMDAYDRVCRILDSHHCYLDFSLMGAGKTFLTVKVAQHLRIPILVICPKTVKNVWHKMSKNYRVDIVETLSYESVAPRKSRKTGKPGTAKHGLLNHHPDNIGERKFSMTPKLHNLINSGVLIVFDECQKVKNLSAQHYACAILARAVLGSNLSRFVLLSGSPIDKQEQTINFMHFIGFIVKPKLHAFYKNKSSFELLGANDLISVAKSVDKEGTDRFLAENELEKTRNHSTKEVVTFCHRLFVEVISPRIVITMPAPMAPLDVKNGFYKMSPESRYKLNQALDNLATTANNVVSRKIPFGALTPAFRAVEMAKREIFENCARKTLKYHPNCKVIIFLNFTELLGILSDALREYNPLIIRGETTDKMRDKYVDDFQTDPQCRLLIVTIQTGAMGISLHDLAGDSPRISFVSPSHHIQLIHQACYRAARHGAKSTSTVRNVYGVECEIETKIIDSLSRKGKIMKEVLSQQEKDNIKFPCDYDSEIEP